MAEKPGQFKDDVFKKWFRSKDTQGFLSLSTWLEAGKATVDIGETVGGGVSNTKVFVEAIQLAVFLRAVNEGRAAQLYPKTKNTPTAESFVYFGGGPTKEGKDISRVLKINHWQTKFGKDPEFDSRSFVFKAGHFGATKTGSGAFMPNFNDPISTNMIKMTRLEVADMSYRLDMELQAFVSKHEDPFRMLNGNDR